jgi:hypothetical protein
MVADDFHFDGDALAALLAERHGTAVRITPGRYHHGKVIQWAVGGRRWALVGSPNCTVAALGRTVGDHDGNCEIALVCEVNATLTPAHTEPVAPLELAAHLYRPVTAAKAPLLYAALVEQDGVRLLLRRPADVELRVEVYEGATWCDTGRRVPVGVVDHMCQDWHPARSACVRVVSAGGEEAGRAAATVLTRLDPRPASRTDLGGSSGEFIDNPTFITSLQTALARIRISLAAAHGIRAAGAQTVRAGEDHVASRPTWQEIVERVRVETGERFSWFSLPTLAHRAGLLPPDVALDDGAEVASAGVAGEAETSELTGTDLDRFEQMAEYRERRIAALRRWCTRFYDPDLITDAERVARRRAAADAGFDPSSVCSEVDVAVAAVVLAAHQLGAWEDPDDEAITLTRALRPLGRPLADDCLAPDAAAVAAVGLWVLDGLVAVSAQRLSLRSTYQGVARRLAALVDRIDEAALVSRCLTLATVTRAAPSADEVFSFAVGVAAPDLAAELIARLDVEEAIIAEMTGRVIDIVAELPGDGIPLLVRWLGWASHLSPIALRARTRTAGVVTFAWDSPELVIVVDRPKPRRVLYHLPGGPVVAVNPDNGRIDIHYEQNTWFGDTPPPAAERVLRRCGIDEQPRS